MAFKGGYVLNKIISEPEVPRATIDVDFSIAIDSYYEDVKSVLHNIGDSLLSLEVIESYEIKEMIGPTSSGGIKLHRGNASRDLGVDVGLHDISHGTVPMTVFGIDISRFSVERMLSDKISAIYSRRRFRRPKDLYDFYILTNCFDVNMADLMNEVNIRDTIDWDASPHRIEVVTEYAKAYNSLVVHHPQNIDVDVAKPEFKDALKRVADFVNNWDANLKWNCNERRFLRC